MTLTNKHNKPLDSFDMLKLKIAVQSLLQPSQAYSVVSLDGIPMFGCHRLGEVPVRFVATGWALEQKS